MRIDSNRFESVIQLHFPSPIFEHLWKSQTVGPPALHCLIYEQNWRSNRKCTLSVPTQAVDSLVGLAGTEPATDQITIQKFFPLAYPFTYTASQLPVLDQAIPPISPIRGFAYLFFLDCYEVLITKDLVGRVPGTKRHQPVREQSEYRVAPQNIIKILQKWKTLLNYYLIY